MARRIYFDCLVFLEINEHFSTKTHDSSVLPMFPSSPQCWFAFMGAVSVLLPVIHHNEAALISVEDILIGQWNDNLIFAVDHTAQITFLYCEETVSQIIDLTVLCGEYLVSVRVI